MRKIFLLTLLAAATIISAETKVETFDVKDGTQTATYESNPVTKECKQASWTVFIGGFRKGLGDMGDSNWAAVTRAKLSTETYEGYPYLLSSTISGGIDSLWFTWNSNGDETGYDWNVKVYVNDQLVGAITEPGGPKAASPFHTFSVGHLRQRGNFTIKIVNESVIGTDRKMRMVVDNLSWTTYDPVAQLAFDEPKLIKHVGDAPFINPLSNTSGQEASFLSSNPDVATVNPATGEVTIVGEGTTLISASIEETDAYDAETVTYTLRVIPENAYLETFEGATNVTGDAFYLATPTASIEPSSATGLTWTTCLGSIRNSLASFGEGTAVIIRGKKDEAEYGYLLSDSIDGGIDALAFDWNSHYDESSRQHNWDIQVFVNDHLVGNISEACAEKKAAGEEYRFAVNNLRVEGKFVIRIINNNIADDLTKNQYRWVMDNLEWVGYAPGDTTAIENTEVQVKARKVIENGNVIIIRNGIRYNMQGKAL